MINMQESHYRLWMPFQRNSYLLRYNHEMQQNDFSVYPVRLQEMAADLTK